MFEGNVVRIRRRLDQTSPITRRFAILGGKRSPGTWRANAIMQAHAHGATCFALARESKPHALGPSRSRLGPTRARKAHYAQSPTTQTRNTTGLQTPAPQHGHQAAHECSTAARFGPTSVVRAIPVEPEASVGAAQVLREGVRDDARCVRDAIQPSDQRSDVRRGCGNHPVIGVNLIRAPPEGRMATNAKPKMRAGT